MNKAAIGIDIGGTRIKAVILNSELDIVDNQIVLTLDNKSDENWKVTVKDIVQQLTKKHQIIDYTIGISAPGIADKLNQSIAIMPGRLSGLANFIWSDYLEKNTWVINDAVAALNAELCLGIAKNKKNAVLITLGTGVGGALLINGEIYQGSFQTAGHLGHISTFCDGKAGITGMPGSLEDAIGNATIYERSKGQFSSTQKLLEAVKLGNHFANWIWLNSIQKLAVSIASINNILSPECIIIGGGIAEADELLFNPLNEFLKNYNWDIHHKIELLKTTQADLSGAVGAACFALNLSKSSS